MSVQGFKMNKRQKKYEGNEMGADVSSPDKQPSTKQSEESDEPAAVQNSSASKNNNTLAKQAELANLMRQSDLQNGVINSTMLASTGRNMDNYLNEENLKHLERISKCVKLDFGMFTREMIMQEQNPGHFSQRFNRLVKDKAELSIETLQQRTIHVQKNKLSDKFSRRDIQFYDLYIKKENGEELALLKDNQYPLEIDAEQYYQELEIDDFNHLFANNMLIEERFGKTIKIEVTRDPSQNRITRNVKEFAELVQTKDNRRRSSDINQSAMKYKTDQKDPELISIHQSLRQFEKDYGKASEEIAEIFCKVSGRLNKMKDYLENRPVIEWSYLEDLALAKPDDSPEFQVLLSTKGWEEIMIRRDFLHATPVISDDEGVKQ